MIKDSEKQTAGRLVVFLGTGSGRGIRAIASVARGGAFHIRWRYHWGRFPRPSRLPLGEIIAAILLLLLVPFHNL